jgi:hypothetical protein
MSQQRPYKRKFLNLGVNRGMQFRMIAKMTAILFLCLLITGLTYYYFANQEITGSFKLFHIKARNFLDFLLPAVIGSLVASFVVGVTASLFFPQSYAGGLYGIERDLKKLIDGDLGVRVKLREGDEAIPLAGTVNELVNCFRGKILHLQDELGKMQEILASEAGGSPEERLAALRRIHGQLMEELKQLKVARDERVKNCF